MNGNDNAVRVLLLLAIAHMCYVALLFSVGNIGGYLGFCSDAGCFHMLHQICTVMGWIIPCFVNPLTFAIVVTSIVFEDMAKKYRNLLLIYLSVIIIPHARLLLFMLGNFTSFYILILSIVINAIFCAALVIYLCGKITVRRNEHKLPLKFVYLNFIWLLLMIYSCYFIYDGYCKDTMDSRINKGIMALLAETDSGKFWAKESFLMTINLDELNFDKMSNWDLFSYLHSQFYRSEINYGYDALKDYDDTRNGIHTFLKSVYLPFSVTNSLLPVDVRVVSIDKNDNRLLDVYVRKSII